MISTRSRVAMYLRYPPAHCSPPHLMYGLLTISLAELKRFIRPGVEFKTVSHANLADMVGLTRVVTTVQTVGFYSKIKDQPEHPFSTCNHGKGF